MISWLRWSATPTPYTLIYAVMFQLELDCGWEMVEMPTESSMNGPASWLI